MRLFFPGKRYTRLALIACVVLLVILLGANKLFAPAGPRANPLNQTVSVPELTSQATEIVQGRVESVVGTFNSQWNSDSSKDLEIVYTDYHLTVTNTLKGGLNKGDIVVLRCLGQKGNKDIRDLDYNIPTYQVGKQFLLFLQRSPTTDIAYMAVDGAGGVFQVDGNNAENQQDHQQTPLAELQDEVR